MLEIYSLLKEYLPLGVHVHIQINVLKGKRLSTSTCPLNIAVPRLAATTGI